MIQLNVARSIENNVTCNCCGNELTCSKCNQPQKHGTAFSEWSRERASGMKDSQLLTITNLDYVVEVHHVRNGGPRVRRLPGLFMLVEEKRNHGKLHIGQCKTFREMDKIYRYAEEKLSQEIREDPCPRKPWFEYWGFFLLQFGKTSRPSRDRAVYMNGLKIDYDSLVAHLNGEQKFCDGLFQMPKNEIDKLTSYK